MFEKKPQVLNKFAKNDKAKLQTIVLFSAEKKQNTFSQ